jgi:type III pantothenate kinase
MELSNNLNVLVFDRGNTFLKVALFHQHNILYVSRFNALSGQELNLLVDELELKYALVIKHSIISSVIPEVNDWYATLDHRTRLLEFNHKTNLPIKNSYRTPRTLGKDRIAAVVGASSLFPGDDLLIIDAGTCITFDFINANKEYFGGAISPGLNLRFKCLHNFTGNLPLVYPVTETNLIGDSTESSLLSGVINGIREEVDGIINRYKLSFPKLKVVFTGGDIKYFDKYLKNNIFAVENLVLQGLKDILHYNVKE